VTSGFAKHPVRRVEASGEPVDRGAWWARIPAVRAVLDDGLDLHPGVTFLVGENGSGKSTLVEALAVAYGLNPEGGSRGARHSTRVSESPLGDALRLIRSPGGKASAYFLRAETTHGLYTYLEQLPRSPDRDLHDRSHGEGFLALLQRKFSGPGFYLMDEPESALSFTSTLSLLARLHDLAETGAQVIVATHSPLLVALPGARIVALDSDGLRYVEDWRTLDLVTHWRAYLADPDRYLRHLLE
jgi:predicted ATPase